MDMQHKRHKFLTFWLYLIIVVNIFAALTYFFSTGTMQLRFHNIPVWMFHVMGILGVIDAISAIALLKWKKWGFWVYCVVAVISLFIGMHFKMMGIIPAVLAVVIAVGILYWALNMGGENKAWNKLT